MRVQILQSFSILGNYASLTDVADRRKTQDIEKRVRCAGDLNVITPITDGTAQRDSQLPNEFRCGAPQSHGKSPPNARESGESRYWLTGGTSCLQNQKGRGR